MSAPTLPDPANQKICLRCHKWFDPSAGTLTGPEATGPISSILQTAAVLSGHEQPTRFICHRCTRFRQSTQLTIFGAFAAVVALALLLGWLGII